MKQFKACIFQQDNVFILSFIPLLFLCSEELYFSSVDFLRSGLERKKMNNIEGGNLPLFISVMGAVIYAYNEGDDFIKGYKVGLNRTAKI